jgi:polar amino acid transport system permease protein
MSDRVEEGHLEESRSGPGFFDLANDKAIRRIGSTLSLAFALGVLAMLAFILFVNERSAIDVDLFFTILPQFLQPLWVVLQVFLLGSVLSVFFGIFVGLARVSKSPITNGISTAYVEFFRGTPLLFQIIVVYYGVPALWPPGEFPFTTWWFPAAVLAFTLNHAAYEGEAIRGGIAAVPDGQMEAARSLGMSYTQGMREVVLPQAWRNALAAIGNDMVILVKDTSLLTVIAAPELISQFRNVNSTYFDPWTPILILAIAYLAITVPLGKLVRYMERRADWEGEHE